MESKCSIVIYFAHLDIDRSVINRTLCHAVRDLPLLQFRDLHELYPDFFINVAKEQSIMRDADLIVFQHPIYWYSSPAIFKHFLDTVFIRGFAYGPEGTVLQGKDFLLVASTGAESKEYQSNGLHHYSFTELTHPIEQTARFCGMNYLPPLVLHGGHSVSQDMIDNHAEQYCKLLEVYNHNNHRAES